MGTLKTEITEIVSTMLLSHHEDLRKCHILIRYGREKFVINADQLLNMCTDENNPLLINNLLTDSNRCDEKSEENIIGEIRVVDNVNNEIDSFTVGVKDVSEKSGLFNRILYDNLRMIDGDMPMLLTKVVETVDSNGHRKTSDILVSLLKSNPIHIDKAWQVNTYRFKLGRLLYNIALGMNESRVWHGNTPKGGIICRDGNSYKGFGYYDQTTIGNFLIDSTEFVEEDARCHIKLSEA